MGLYIRKSVFDPSCGHILAFPVCKFLHLVRQKEGLYGEGKDLSAARHASALSVFGSGDVLEKKISSRSFDTREEKGNAKGREFDYMIRPFIPCVALCLITLLKPVVVDIPRDHPSSPSWIESALRLCLSHPFDSGTVGAREEERGHICHVGQALTTTPLISQPWAIGRPCTTFYILFVYGVLFSRYFTPSSGGGVCKTRASGLGSGTNRQRQEMELPPSFQGSGSASPILVRASTVATIVEHNLIMISILIRRCLQEQGIDGNSV
ncbi:hypothetical protein BO79DRAFT_229309 [Aspergillus costaricaensis CBS 115574]|uniref:Uncharacterized protein n=1 Tax=Aspergillus costaricaensis CBS 115574 TaxID=1448317 RepID=A0ACD1IBZ7_9EURO|nr:hypothetical protein BO79DRAFT_229309 [Aspergillus costaricaensis CBS 115574]RAK87816.1 hypothetical protein BO79DRAFT_229309 [Aspergillus costaricaensis CBS 115574]